MVGSRKSSGPRAARISELVRHLSEPDAQADEMYAAIAALIADAALEGDAPALRIAQTGLYRLHGRSLTGLQPSAAQLENRGRARALLDLATWVLRRIGAVGFGGESDSDQALLSAIAERPGATVEELAVALGLPPRDVAAAVPRLSRAGLVVPRGSEQHEVWELSPRGRAYLRTA